ncbi:MAG: RagB/SusD family nutrient uptake outer membrane protein [Pedobacter sp.]|uniref:RagB/SusD family nutrient uptake outer membrane protein n=1 Tax=Pedobacter sp. TaxID=1411316 RepID=UPI002806A98A|nr:RagB/SusD family nutrient uptake outer membrane protein [Pedobacter sp.]MDQ8005260.1 RagB/SusD family nutrient uptake outer membrane protein [Pedobacter sp.]
MERIYKAISILLFSIFGLSCKEYLDVKPDKKLVVVSTVEDLQALLDNFGVMNYSDPSVAEICADNYFLTDAVFQARKETERNIYVWGVDNVFDERNNAWTDVYKQVYIANLVIEQATAMETSNPNATAVKAQALFFRAKAFLNVASVWAPAYSEPTANETLGIPLRLGTDFNVKTTRASLKETYRQITDDLLKATRSLPVKQVHLMRPNKAAAFGMLARSFLMMQNYDQAYLYADSCLKLNSELIDYNTLNVNDNFPFAAFNKEVIHENRYGGSGHLAQTRALINPELYALYEPNDLRKTLFFKSSGTNFIFKGYYSGSGNFFNGLATDELLLIRAESAARIAKLNNALDDLNYLRRNRFKKANYIDLQMMSAANLLIKIKEERRRELPFRGLRWMDIKRWNKEGDNIVLSRTVNNTNHVLLPNSLRYAIQIPADIIELSGIAQNPR